jgi:ribose transport system permease protein
MSVLTRINNVRKSTNLVDIMPITTLIVLIIIMSIGSPRFLLPASILGLLAQSATLLVMGLGETFVILLGSIDLSIAPVAAMATIVAAMLIPKFGYLAFVIALLFGVFAGWLTGFVHTRAKIPSFIASLGAMGLWTGIGFVVSQATPITVTSDDIFLTKWVTGTTFGVDNVVYIAAVVLFITYILEKYTRFGRYVKAIGAGEKATRVSGVPIERYKTLAFVLCGTLAAFTGVLLSARMAGGSARMADGFLMKAIAVVILGGTAISGGIGGVLRTCIGVLIVMTLDVGMNMIGINPWFQQAVYGGIIILAVALTIDRSRITIIK